MVASEYRQKMALELAAVSSQKQRIHFLTSHQIPANVGSSQSNLASVNDLRGIHELYCEA